jgi:hypothetical protein
LFEARPKGKKELHRRCNVANTNSGIHWWITFPCHPFRFL